MTQVYTKRRLVPGRVVLFGIVLGQITIRVHQPLPLLTPTGQQVLLVVLKAISMLLTLTKLQVKYNMSSKQHGKKCTHYLETLYPNLKALAG